MNRRIPIVIAAVAALLAAGCGSHHSRLGAGYSGPLIAGAGTPVAVGNTLTTTNGTWAYNPTRFSYQWQHCNGSCTTASGVGANTSTYIVASNDTGSAIRVLVTAWNSGGSSTQASDMTSVVGGGTTSSTTSSSSTSTTTTSTSTTTSSTTTSTTTSSSTSTGSYVCTQHVTTSTFAAAYSAAGTGDVLCLAAGSYGSFSGSSKASMVVITPDLSAGGTPPTGNATGGVDGNVKFTGFNFSPAANITMDGITFTGNTSMDGSTHNITLHDSIFHQHLQIDDASMQNANIVVDFNLFPADTAVCVGDEPEGRIWVKDGGVTRPQVTDGVLIENNNIGGVASVQCDGVNLGSYGTHVINNWIHDFHFANAAHTDGIQDYGGSHEVVTGNLMYNVPDCYVAYDGANHADVENNVCVNDGDQNNGASPNDLNLLADTAGGSTIKHNTVVAYKDTFGNPGGCISLGSKDVPSSGTQITDNVATCLVDDSGGVTATFTENHNLWVHDGPSGTGDLHGAPTYLGGACGNLTSNTPPFCVDVWSNFLLASGSLGFTGSDTGGPLGAFGTGPVTPGGP